MLIGSRFYLWTHKELVYKGRASELPQGSWQKLHLSAIDLLNLCQVISDGQSSEEHSHLFWDWAVRFYLPVFPSAHKYTQIDVEEVPQSTQGEIALKEAQPAGERLRMQTHIFCFFTSVILNSSGAPRSLLHNWKDVDSAPHRCSFSAQSVCILCLTFTSEKAQTA